MIKNDISKILLKRIFSSVVVLFLLVSFMFILLRLAPGDPSDKFISPQLSPELAAKVKESFNLNSSIFDQYKTFVFNLARGDFGISYNYRQPVLTVIMQYLPFTLIFSLVSFFIQISFGFWFASISIKKINGRVDNLLTKLSLIVYSLPSFVTGVFLIYIFSAVLNVFPSSGLTSFDFDSFSFWGKVLDYSSHLILPLITLSLGGIAVFYKYLRDSLEETYNKSFVQHLRSNGISEKIIFIKHVIPNAVGPLISVAGVELGILFGGALITEVIFALPGMGRLTINAILSRDYPLVIGCSFIAGILVILSNFIADILKAKIDKRLINGILN